MFSFNRQAKSAEVSATKRKNREKDFEPTSQDRGDNDHSDNDNNDNDYDHNAHGPRKGAKGKKRARGNRGGGGFGGEDAEAKGEDIERLKKGFLGGSNRATSNNGGQSLAAAQDFVQPKKKAKRKEAVTPVRG